MDTIKEYGQDIITTEKDNRIRIVTVIGEIEGHTVATDSTKTTKYEHMIPLLLSLIHI